MFAAETEKQLHELKAQKARWEKWGNDKLELLDADGVREVVASDRYVGALLDKSGGHIHPLNLALGRRRPSACRGQDLRAVCRHQHHAGSACLVKTAKGRSRRAT